METARLKKTHEILGDRMGKDVFFLSITVDPDADSVEVLNKYRRNFDARDGWLFLTGKKKAEQLVCLL